MNEKRPTAVQENVMAASRSTVPQSEGLLFAAKDMAALIGHESLGNEVGELRWDWALDNLVLEWAAQS